MMLIICTKKKLYKNKKIKINKFQNIQTHFLNLFHKHTIQFIQLAYIVEIHVPTEIYAPNEMAKHISMINSSLLLIIWFFWKYNKFIIKKAKRNIEAVKLNLKLCTCINIIIKLRNVFIHTFIILLWSR